MARSKGRSQVRRVSAGPDLPDGNPDFEMAYMGLEMAIGFEPVLTLRKG